MPVIICETCGAEVDTDIAQPPNLTDTEATEWWDRNAEDWCPVYGEFRQIINHGHKPCEVS